MFQKLLIANRGEIACRILRTAHRLKIPCVAIYADPDQSALFVQHADEAYRVGPAKVQDSYLNQARILEIAKQTSCDAIHPGYGFLSENPDFAKACQKAGMTFIGPSIDALTLMGSKEEAKRCMAKAKVPIVPGYQDTDQTEKTLENAAKKIGFPLLIKASAGGGGKGMRIVEKPEDFLTQLTSAKREASASFGDDRVILEKYLKDPRHIEFQIFADQHGNVVHLFERDCSYQRRYQKIIEEAPAPRFPKALRENMANAAIAAAKAINYEGAGTIEFLVSPDHDFYFMEMNTRLQVEHPVTEMITGFDLVEWQLKVASGAPLLAKQSQIKAHGHAIEARVYAEDPTQQFLPATGTLTHCVWPETHDHLRIETGVQQGDTISPFYDPMIAKIIVWESSRDKAIDALAQALNLTHIAGVTTNLDYLKGLLTLPAFKNANISTQSSTQFHEALTTQDETSVQHALALAALWELTTPTAPAHQQDPYSPWDQSNAWAMNLPPQHRYTFLFDGDPYTVTVTQDNQTFTLSLNDTTTLTVTGLTQLDTRLHAQIDQQTVEATIFDDAQTLVVFGLPQTLPLHRYDPAQHYAQEEAAAGHLSAPMPGTIIEVLTQSGEHVSRGDRLLIIEAMKMEHTIQAPAAGTVKDIYFKQGDQVNEGQELLAFEVATEDSA